MFPSPQNVGGTPIIGARPGAAAAAAAAPGNAGYAWGSGRPLGAL